MIGNKVEETTTDDKNNDDKAEENDSDPRQQVPPLSDQPKRSGNQKAEASSKH